MPVFYAVMDVDDCEGVDKIAPAEARNWGLKVQCSTCDDESPGILYVDADESSARDGGMHNFVAKCKFCGAAMTVDVMEPPTDSGYYSAEETKPKNVVAAFEVRGCHPTFLELDDEWKVVTSSGAKFEKVDLSTDWFDYDTDAQSSVAISGVSVHFEKAKKK